MLGIDAVLDSNIRRFVHTSLNRIQALYQGLIVLEFPFDPASEQEDPNTGNIRTGTRIVLQVAEPHQILDQDADTRLRRAKPASDMSNSQAALAFREQLKKSESSFCRLYRSLGHARLPRSKPGIFLLHFCSFQARAPRGAMLRTHGAARENR